MKLILNYEKYMNDKNINMEKVEEQFRGTAIEHRLVEELKHQLNAVEIYELKIKNLERDLEYVQFLRAEERKQIEKLEMDLSAYRTFVSTSKTDE